MKKKYIIALLITSIITCILITIHIIINDPFNINDSFFKIQLKNNRLFYSIIPYNPKSKENNKVTMTTLYNSMVMGADWILKMQEETGRYNYWYDPIKNEFSEKYDDNFLRQAGTAYSMMLVYEMTGDERYYNSTKHSVEFLLKFIKYLDNDKAYFLFHGKAKLGGISLPMLSMLKMKELTGTDEYDKVLFKLANMILHLQSLYNTGQYKSTFIYRGDYEYEKSSGWESKIYPGEAMLALTYMYKIFKTDKYKASVDYAMDYYYKNNWKSHAFLPWTISAFVLMYTLHPKKKYSDYVYFLTEQLLTKQNTNKHHYAYGGFHKKPSANTGSYLEGLGDALSLALIRDDKDKIEKYKKRLLIGYRWLLTLQYTKNNSKKLKNPEKAIGGFYKNQKNKKLRIDNTQHIISSFSKGLKHIYHIKPKVKPKNLPTYKLTNLINKS